MRWHAELKELKNNRAHKKVYSIKKSIKAFKKE